MNSQDQLKELAANRAVELVESGMIVGLGTGSTAAFAVKRIAQRLDSGDLTDIVGIPSSLATEELAGQLGIRLAGFESHTRIDVTIDGADEVDPDLNLIKGGGGALLREKVLAQATQRNVIIVDESKMSPKLGTTWALPIEVIPFAKDSAASFIESLGAKVRVRMTKDQSEFLTDQNNIILDADFGPMSDPLALAAKLNERAGIVEHGLFLDLTADVVVAGREGIEHLRKKD